MEQEGKTALFENSHGANTSETREDIDPAEAKRVKERERYRRMKEEDEGRLKELNRQKNLLKKSVCVQCSSLQHMQRGVERCKICIGENKKTALEEDEVENILQGLGMVIHNRETTKERMIRICSKDGCPWTFVLEVDRIQNKDFVPHTASETLLGKPVFVFCFSPDRKLRRSNEPIYQYKPIRHEQRKDLLRAIEVASTLVEPCANTNPRLFFFGFEKENLSLLEDPSKRSAQEQVEALLPSKEEIKRKRKAEWWRANKGKAKKRKQD